MPSLFLIDVSGYLFRSYYALPPMNSPSGRPVQALHGLARSVVKLIEDFNPDYLVAVFDGKDAKNRRRQLYADYKAHRSKTPDELIEQIVQAPALCRSLGLQTLIDDEHEADDLIAAACAQARAKGCKVYICSSDKDLLQLVEADVYQLHTHKENALIGPEKVKELLGVEPSQVADWLALCGDSSDNIPGVEGIGPKTAAQLLERWGSLENLIEHLDELGPKKKAKFNVEMARVSKKLATLFSDFEFTLDWDPFKLAPESSWKPLLSELGLRAIIKSLSSMVPKVDHANVYPVIEKKRPEQLNTPSTPSLENQIFDLVDLFESLIASEQILAPVSPEELGQDWSALCNYLKGLDPDTSVQIEALQKDLWAVKALDKVWILEKAPGQLDLKQLSALPLQWQTSHVQKTHIALEAVGIDLNWKWHDDLVIAAHLFYADARALDVVKAIAYALNKDEEEIKQTLELAQSKDLQHITKLLHLLKGATHRFVCELDNERLCLYREVEVPLALVLARLHRRGFHVDRERFAELSSQMHAQIEGLKTEITQIVGQSFNLNSPKQLAGVLFEKLGLPIIRKTKTGASTDSETLLELEDQHPVISLLLKYREWEKLRSTYLDALPGFVQADGRIHPYFEQSSTATGRLSCHQPNLQNIPVRTPEGLMIRSAFTAGVKNHLLLSADYSQIELRMMAHLSEDPALIEAFCKGEDIHRYTAALVFEKSLEEVSSKERSLAKAVNFGIIYGQQAFGLSKQIGVTVAEASNFIRAYFERYPGVKRYLESCKEEALSLGYVKTLKGRRRHIPEMKSPKHTIRQLGERLSINTPVQGSAAELIKLAMLALEKQLSHEPIRMILQVHDELIFEGAAEDLDRLTPCIQQTMESILSLKVPLVVNISIGKNWMEC